MSAANALSVIIDLPFLATEVNDAHRQVTFHARSMLLEARRAGDALIAAKRLVAHGEFKAWLKAHCACSHTTACEYMRVSKLSKFTDLRNFEGGIRAFLEAHAKPREKPQEAPSEAPAPFSRADAEYALKLAAMAQRGATEHERAAARKKLEGFATGFGMGPEEVVSKAHSEVPDAGLTDAEAAVAQAREELASIKAQMDALMKRRSEVREAFEAMSHDDLIDWAVAKTLEEEFAPQPSCKPTRGGRS